MAASLLLNTSGKYNSDKIRKLRNFLVDMWEKIRKFGANSGLVRNRFFIDILINIYNKYGNKETPIPPLKTPALKGMEVWVDCSELS